MDSVGMIPLYFLAMQAICGFVRESHSGWGTLRNNRDSTLDLPRRTYTDLSSSSWKLSVDEVREWAYLTPGNTEIMRTKEDGNQRIQKESTVSFYYINYSFIQHFSLPYHLLSLVWQLLKCEISVSYVFVSLKRAVASVEL